MSRSRFLLILARQNSVCLDGTWPHFQQPCQNQPSVNTASFASGKKKSGRPERPFGCNCHDTPSFSVHGGVPRPGGADQVVRGNEGTILERKDCLWSTLKQSKSECPTGCQKWCGLSPLSCNNINCSCLSFSSYSYFDVS